MKITILGAGNWGTTMALVLQRTGHRVTLWEYDIAQAELVSRTRKNEKFLPGYVLPNEITVTSGLDAALDSAELCLLAVPVQKCSGVLRNIRRIPANALIVSLMKGIEQSSLKRVSEICLHELPAVDSSHFAVISGPTIAPEVAAGLPTTAVVASSSHETAETVQKEFSTRELRLYTSNDVIGVELAGALKNVIALAAGMCDGMKLGYNTKGALLTRGLAEIKRLGVSLGGDKSTFGGLSGMGDLITTCSSPHSRNHTVGERIGRGDSPTHVLENMVMVAEGVWTAQAASDLARKRGIEMPITEMVRRVIYEGKDPRASVSELMLRNLKAED
ncbi:NAD(P)-dependent glycerol-3-phosphate dehydrogenase [candidate division KSB1 bacterium]|nr:MAG: NAD(P)-dependent glycerol-3-phosphate dehydrogenase [candidate division KSB1 bacterium]